MKESPTTPEWEKGFDARYGGDDETMTVSVREVRTFIRTLLQAQQKAVMDVVTKQLILSHGGAFSDDNGRYNAGVIAVRTALNELFSKQI